MQSADGCFLIRGDKKIPLSEVEDYQLNQEVELLA
jgi:hypothetical protein